MFARKFAATDEPNPAHEATRQPAKASILPLTSAKAAGKRRRRRESGPDTPPAAELPASVPFVPHAPDDDPTAAAGLSEPPLPHLSKGGELRRRATDTESVAPGRVCQAAPKSHVSQNPQLIDYQLLAAEVVRGLQANPQRQPADAPHPGEHVFAAGSWPEANPLLGPAGLPGAGQSSGCFSPHPDPLPRGERGPRATAFWLDRYAAHLAAAVELAEVSGRYVRQTLRQLRAVAAVAGWGTIDAIDDCSVERALETIRTTHQGRRGHARPGARTLGFYRQSAQQFCRWLAGRKSGRPLAADPLRDLEAPPVRESQRRVERRALTIAEFEALYLAALDGPRREGMTGPDRARLYLAAAYTGYRRSELARMTPANFDAETHSLNLAAAGSKRRRRESQILADAVCDELARWMAGRGGPATAPLWPMAPWCRTADMIYADCAAAGIAKCDADGRIADFHSLRSTFQDFVAQAGASMKVAQILCRHSDPRLTWNTYGKRNHARELADVARRMPAVPKPQHHYPLFAGLEAAW